MCVCECERTEIKNHCRHICALVFLHVWTKNSWALYVFGDMLCVVAVASNDLFFPITPSAYVWFIYIHGYPDNEAFNPGDPVVRTMNPITSCRLWDGMADSETDGRGCTRPAIQSHSSRLLPRFPCSCVLQQLINRQGPKNLRSLHHTPTLLQTHTSKNTIPGVQFPLP